MAQKRQRGSQDDAPSEGNARDDLGPSKKQRFLCSECDTDTGSQKTLNRHYEEAHTENTKVICPNVAFCEVKISLLFSPALQQRK